MALMFPFAATRLPTSPSSWLLKWACAEPTNGLDGLLNTNYAQNFHTDLPLFLTQTMAHHAPHQRSPTCFLLRTVGYLAPWACGIYTVGDPGDWTRPVAEPCPGVAIHIPRGGFPV